jgi:ABC-2 type transport system ATP-binding protein
MMGTYFSKAQTSVTTWPLFDHGLATSPRRRTFTAISQAWNTSSWWDACGISESLLELKATRLLKLLHLESWQYSPISTYSKGMKQRVLIAASLLHNPRLLVFDEPLSGLDVMSARLFKDLLELLAAEGKAILYISHVLEVVEQICRRVIVIAKGKILADASPGELTRLMSLPNLESVFSQLVSQQDTRSIAGEMVEVMRLRHG